MHIKAGRVGLGALKLSENPSGFELNVPLEDGWDGRRRIRGEQRFTCFDSLPMPRH